jgi:hypothetical protein
MARIIAGEPMHPLKRKLLEERVVWHCGIGASQMDTIEDGNHIGVRPSVPVAAVRGGELLHMVHSNAGQRSRVQVRRLEHQPVGVGDGGKVEGDSTDHIRLIGTREPFAKALNDLPRISTFLSLRGRLHSTIR